MLQQPSGIPDTSGYHVRHGCHGVAVARAASCVDPRLRRPVVAVEPQIILQPPPQDGLKGKCWNLLFGGLPTVEANPPKSSPSLGGAEHWGTSWNVNGSWKDSRNQYIYIHILDECGVGTPTTTKTWLFTWQRLSLIVASSKT